MENQINLTTQEFKAWILSSLAKLGNRESIQAARQQIKSLLESECFQTNDHIMIILAALDDTRNLQSQLQRSEYIKIYGMFWKALQESSIPYISRIVASLIKPLATEEIGIHQSLSISFARIAHSTLHLIPDLRESCQYMFTILNPLFRWLKHKSHQVQLGSGVWLISVLQHVPLECLRYTIDSLVSQIQGVLRARETKCHSVLIEALTTILISVEHDYAEFVPETVSTLVYCMQLSDPRPRKSAIDWIYTIGLRLPFAVQGYAGELYNILNKCRQDKSKEVRQAANETVHIYKDMADALELHQRGEITTSAVTQIKEKGELNSQKSVQASKGPVNPNFFKSQQSQDTILIPKKPRPNQNRSSVKSNSLESSALHVPRINVPVSTSEDRRVPASQQGNYPNPNPAPNMYQYTPSEESQDSASALYEPRMNQIMDKVNSLERENSNLRADLASREVHQVQEVQKMNKKIVTLEGLLSSMNLQVKNKLDRIESHLSPKAK